MSEINRITVTVSPEMKRKLKILAAAHSTNLSELTIRLYEQVLQANPVSDPCPSLSI